MPTKLVKVPYLSSVPTRNLLRRQVRCQYDGNGSRGVPAQDLVNDCSGKVKLLVVHPTKLGHVCPNNEASGSSGTGGLASSHELPKKGFNCQRLKLLTQWNLNFCDHVATEI